MDESLHDTTKEEHFSWKNISEIGDGLAFVLLCCLLCLHKIEPEIGFK